MYRIVENVDRTEKIERLTYSILETAKALGVSSRTVHKLYKSGELGHIRVGQRVLVPADVLRQFIEQRTSGRVADQSQPLHQEAEDIP